MLDFSLPIEFNRRALISDLKRRLERALTPFHLALDNLLARLFRDQLPADWRDRWRSFVAEQSAQGFTIAEESAGQMEEWIEAWAKECGLLEVLTGVDDKHVVDRLVKQPHDAVSSFTITVVPDVSGPNLSEKATKLESVESYAAKVHLPADSRGTWVEGTKGNGAFRFHDTPENRAAGVAKQQFKFRGNNIAVGGFPAGAYFGGDANAASVTIETVKGTKADARAATRAMRIKLKDPNWVKPKGFVWNHAGPPGSKVMELVDRVVHRALAHRGPAAQPRGAYARGVNGRAMAALNVYLTLRDALREIGVLQPEYTVTTRADYYFSAEDGSVFIVYPAWFFRSSYIQFVAGPRVGDRVQISTEEVAYYLRIAEKKWGKYIPGNLWRQPRFTPGTDRRELPLLEESHDGLIRGMGWIDEEGVHYREVPGPSVG